MAQPLFCVTAMADSLLLQDWTTINGNVAGTIVKQSEDCYADLLGCRNLTIFMETAELIDTININFDTAPTKDESLFANVAVWRPSIGVTATSVLYATATVPIARYLRWRFATGATTAWACTFRVWLSVTRPRPKMNVVAAPSTVHDTEYDRAPHTWRPPSVLAGADRSHLADINAATGNLTAMRSRRLREV